MLHTGMLNWKELPIITGQDYFGRKLDNLVADWNAECSALREQRHALETEISALPGIDPLMIDLDGLPEFQRDAAKLLQAEIRLRQRYPELVRRCDKARAETYDKAMQAHQAKHDEVQQALVALGYVDPKENPAARVGRILPLDVQKHPEVQRLFLRVRELRSEAPWQSEAINGGAIETCREQLSELLARLAPKAAVPTGR